MIFTFPYILCSISILPYSVYVFSVLYFSWVFRCPVCGMFLSLPLLAPFPLPYLFIALIAFMEFIYSVCCQHLVGFFHLISEIISADMLEGFMYVFTLVIAYSIFAVPILYLNHCCHLFSYLSYYYPIILCIHGPSSSLHTDAVLSAGRGEIFCEYPCFSLFETTSFRAQFDYSHCYHIMSVVY